MPTGEMRASSGQARSMSFSWRTTPSLVPSSPPTDSFAATSVLIVPFFVLFAVMECYANGVLMNFLGSPPALSLCGCSLAPQLLSSPVVLALPRTTKTNKSSTFIPFHQLGSSGCVCVSVSHGWQESAAQAQAHIQTLPLSTFCQALLMSFVPPCCCFCRCSVVGGKLIQ